MVRGKKMADPFLSRRKKHCEAVILAIESCIEGRITADVEQMEVSTTHGAKRSITKIPAAELIKIRQQYLAELEAIRVSEGISPGGRRNVLVRF
jgi:hypothetical protein